MILNKSTIFTFLFTFTTFGYVLVYLPIGDLPTTFWWIFNSFFILFIILLIPKYYNKYEDTSSLFFVKLFLIWNIITAFRGFFIAENYWEWKNLIGTILVSLIPLIAYLLMNKDLLQKILSFWFKYMIYLFLFFIPFVEFTDFYGRYFAPFILLLLVFPILPNKWKVITLIITIFVILIGLDARSHVIRFSAAFGLGSLYYFRAFFIDKFFKAIHFILILLPLILFILGISGIFNVFKMNDYIRGDYKVMSNDTGKLKEDSLTADTRTFLYVENITSAIKNDYVIQGRTPANGYDSKWFGDFMKWELGTGKQQRFSSEVAILNIFTWYGLIGATLYFLIFLKSSYLAVYKSNNYFIKVIGLFVAFRWAYSFVEDYSNFNIQYIFLWVLIAMCFSSSFRSMTDNEFKNWIVELLNNSSLIKLRK